VRTIAAADARGARTIPRLRPPHAPRRALEHRIFKLRNAEPLAEAIPNARLELSADPKAFAQEDQPERLASAIDSFLCETAAVTAAE